MLGRSLRVILNGKVSRDRVEAAVEAVRRRGHAIDVRVTSQATAAATLAKQAVEDKVDVLVAGGGDGTVNEVVNGIFAASAEPGVTAARHGQRFRPELQHTIRGSGRGPVAGRR